MNKDKRSENKLNRPYIKLSKQLYEPIGSTIAKLAEELKKTFDIEVEVIKKEEKKMDLQVGDKATYKSIEEPDEEAREYIIKDEHLLADIVGSIANNEIEILKIERPKYELVEEKKELLTEEEKEFLKQYIKMSSININYIEKIFDTFDEDKSITIKLKDGQGIGVCTYYNKDYFKNLEENKEYSLEELGLEE